MYEEEAGKMIPMIKPANPKVQEFLALLQDPEVYGVFKGLVIQCLTDPDCLVLKRIHNIECHLGVDDDYCLWEDSLQEDKEVMMTIPQQFSLLSDRINDTSIPVLRESILITANETEVRARLLRDKLATIPYQNGKKFMLGTDVQKFLLHEIIEEHRAKEKGVRQIAADVMKKTVEQFPNEVKMRKNEKKRNVIEYIERFYD